MSNEKIYPLTAAQADLIFEELALNQDQAANMNVLGYFAWVPDDFDAAAMEKAFWKMIELNDALRLKIFKKGLSYFQYVQDIKPEILERVTVSGREEFDAYIEKSKLSTAIKMCDDRLFKATIVLDGNGSGGIVIFMHHAVCDGTSFGIMFAQLDKYYNAYKNGEDPVEKKVYSITNYFEQEQAYKHSSDIKKDFFWWLKKYNSQKKYSIPGGRRSAKDCTSSAEEIYIDGDAYQNLLNLCKESHCSIQSVLMTLASVSTWIISGKRNFCFYTMSHGRNTIPLKRTVGCMVTTVPVFFYVDGNTAVKDFVSSSYMDYLDTVSHSRMPFKHHIATSYLQSVRCGFNFMHGWMQYSAMDFANVMSKLSLNFELVKKDYLCCQFYCGTLDVAGKHTQIILEYQTAKFTKEQITKFLAVHKKVIETAVSNPDMSINALKSKVLQEM